MPGMPVRARNDPRQYDDLAAQWWEPRGEFAMLGWIAAARARNVPPVTREPALLLDVACGGGLLAPHLSGSGYHHVGIDLSVAALVQAQDHGVQPVHGDACNLPFADGAFDVVVAGEILEHVVDLTRVVAEVCRVLRVGGTLVVDTIADTWWGRFTSITVGERIPAGPPPRLHDGALFVDRGRLLSEAGRHGITLRLNGLRMSFPGYLSWLAGRREDVRMLPSRNTAGLFQAVGTKAAGSKAAGSKAA